MDRPATDLPAVQRSERLDALRGLAMVWMTLFHAAFDLNHFGLIARQNFYLDPFWTGQRLAIVSLFLACAGASQAVAHAQAVGWPRFWQRWGRVAGCAVLVSVSSWWMFPSSWISFGVLHGLALMVLLARGLAGRPVPVLCAIALVCLALPQLWGHAWFDSRWTHWIGLVTHKPRTEDYVPLMPWFGVLCGGLLAGRWVLARRPHWLNGPLPAAIRPVAALGRWSLSYYMLHQPVLIGLCMAWLALR